MGHRIILVIQVAPLICNKDTLVVLHRTNILVVLPVIMVHISLVPKELTTPALISSQVQGLTNLQGQVVTHPVRGWEEEILQAIQEEVLLLYRDLVHPQDLVPCTNTSPGQPPPCQPQCQTQQQCQAMTRLLSGLLTWPELRLLLLSRGRRPRSWPGRSSRRSP